MTRRGDHEPAMPATPLLDDDAIEAIMTGHAAADVAGPLVAFVDLVRAQGEGAPPPPSPILARLLAEGAAAADEGDAAAALLPGHGAPTARPGGAAVYGRHDDVANATAQLNGATAPAPVIADLPARLPAGAAGRGGRGRRRNMVARVAGAGLAAKVALGAGAAAAGVLGAGVLPGPAGRVARDAIEAVTPIQFPRDDHPADDRPVEGRGGADSDPGSGADEPGEHGDRVSPDATGESDGQPGVDGPQVAETAPGADERSGDTPATTDPPRTPSSTVPPSAPGQPSDPGAPADPGPPPSIPSTIPAPPTTKTAGDAPDRGGTTQTTP